MAFSTTLARASERLAEGSSSLLASHLSRESEHKPRHLPHSLWKQHKCVRPLYVYLTEGSFELAICLDALDCCRVGERAICILKPPPCCVSLQTYELMK